MINASLIDSKKDLRAHFILTLPTVQERFTYIYETQFWGIGECRSGLGSSRESASTFMKAFERFLHDNEIRTIFDAPCGDWSWMRYMKLPRAAEYIGGDIVKPLVTHLQDRYGRAGVRFEVVNVMKDEFASADLWLCRDSLFYLCTKDIREVFRTFLRSDIPLALVSCHSPSVENTEAPTGAFRPVNLLAPPFNLPAPIKMLPESFVTHDRFVGVWPREALISFATSQLP